MATQNSDDIMNIMKVIDQMEHRDKSDQSVPEMLDDIEAVSHAMTSISSPLELSMPNSNEDVNKAVDIIKTQYQDYMMRYGISADFRIEDLFNNLADLTDPIKMKLFQLSLDKTIDRVKLIGLSKLTIALLVALNKTTDPSFINSLNPVDAVGYTDRIFSQLEKISKLKNLLHVKDADAEMSQLVRDINRDSSPKVTREDESMIMDILKELDKE